MLQCSSSEEEREHRRGVNQHMATYASSVDMEDLQTMVAQSHAAQRDPYNKMHGRNLESWSDDEEEPSRPVRLHTGDQLPRRRKKKNKDKKGRQVCVNEDEMMARAWETMMSTTRIFINAEDATVGLAQYCSGSFIFAILFTFGLAWHS